MLTVLVGALSLPLLVLYFTCGVLTCAGGDAYHYLKSKIQHVAKVSQPTTATPAQAPTTSTTDTQTK